MKTITDENIDNSDENIESTSENILTNPQTLISFVKMFFKEKNSDIIIKTPFDTFKFSKEDYETGKVILETVDGSNILFFTSGDKTTITTLTEFSISKYQKN